MDSRIRNASNGTVIQTGFTPLVFAGDSGSAYKISIANYDVKLFQHCEDASTRNVRSVMLTKDTEMTATYDTGDSLRGFTPLAHAGTQEQPELTVNAATIEVNKTLYMWTVIDPRSTSPAGTTYKVYAGNYKDGIFDHWNNGNKGRIRTLTISEARTITAYYKIEPQNIKVEFAYKDCGLFAAGCGVGTITFADGATTGHPVDTTCVWLHGEQEPG